eukprot:503055_1
MSNTFTINKSHIYHQIYNLNQSNNGKLLFTIVLIIKYIQYGWFLSFMICTLCARIKFIRLNNIQCMSIFTTTNGYIINKNHTGSSNKHYSSDFIHAYSYFIYIIITSLAFNTIIMLHKLGNTNSERSCAKDHLSWKKSLKWKKYNFLWRLWKSYQTSCIGHFLCTKADQKQMTFFQK